MSAIVKYFYEEPVHLEALSAEADPDARRRAEPSGSLGDLLRPAAYYRAYLAGSDASVDEAALTEVAAAERRYGIPALRLLLDAGVTVLFPEPAHDGWDWSVFSAAPLRERLVAAFRARPAPGVRRFVLPFQRARSEHTFYFERWRLDDLPDWIEEVG